MELADEAVFDADYDSIVFKILVVGEPSAGKTSLVRRFVHNDFSTSYKATIGVDFASKCIKWDNKTEITLHLWDLAGQERLGTQVAVYFREANGAIVLYDVTKPETQKQVIIWKAMVDEKTHDSSGEHYIPPSIMLVNKIDLLPEPIDILQVKLVARQLGFSDGFGTSVKSDIGIAVAMRALITQMLEIRRLDIMTGKCKKESHETVDLMMTSDQNFGEVPAKSWYKSWC